MSEHGVFATQLLPIDKLVSMPFQSRVSKADPDFEDLVASIQEHGMIEPVAVRPLHDSEGRYEVLAGERRLKAARQLKWSVVPCHIREVSEDVAIVLQAEENLHRKDYDEEDKVHLVSELARLKKWDATEIAKRLHRSYSWVVKYLPDKFKDQEKAEAGQVGGLAKSATQRVAENEKTQDTPQTVHMAKCERCQVVSSTAKLWHNHWLCEVHYAAAQINPEAYDGYFRYLENGKKASVKKPDKPQTPMQMTKYSDREGMMKVQHGQEELDFIKELTILGITPETDSPICLWHTVPDGKYSLKKLACYVHGVVHEKGKVMEKDDEIVAALERLGWTVLVFRHGEGTAKEWALQVQESLKF